MLHLVLHLMLQLVVLDGRRVPLLLLMLLVMLDQDLLLSAVRLGWRRPRMVSWRCSLVALISLSVS